MREKSVKILLAMFSAFYSVQSPVSLGSRPSSECSWLI